MKLSIAGGAVTSYEGGLLVIGRYQEAAPSEAEKAVDQALGGALGKASERLRFKGKPRKKVALDVTGGLAAARVVLIGLGKQDEASPARLRDFAALAVDEARAQRLDTVGLVPPAFESAGAAARALAAGALLGSYRFDQLKNRPEGEDPPAEVTALTLLTDADVEAEMDRGRVIAEAVNETRTLVNEPANICTPERLAQFAREIAEDPDVEVTVLDRAAIAERKMGGLIAVSQGADVEPRFIHLKYTPRGAKGGDEGALALVGKGITFDSGGLNIKPGKSMTDMYIDMAGSAAVLGAMHAVARLKPGIPVHGIVGACENMPSGKSYRPSDVLTMYSGKTVEVLNTDAEGRLVLADAIHYATQLKPKAIVNLATLTGACLVALGQFYAGLFSDDDALAEDLLTAAKSADEKLWRMPLDPKLAESLESKRADITNLGGSYGGAITAAQFLQHFKGDCRWAHIDIAGPTLAEKNDGYVRAGATGYGVMTLLSLIEAWEG